MTTGEKIPQALVDFLSRVSLENENGKLVAKPKSEEEIACERAAHFAEKALPMLKEYGKKISDMIEQLSELRIKSALNRQDLNLRARLTANLERIKAPAEELARQVSAMVEQGKLDDLDRITLWFALSEFETALLEIPTVTKSG